jgi:NAD(P)-dependent dehydrogenase (short-subunit alcohol dehydrogenase family)
LDLTDEAAVTRYYAALPGLWGSVHVAGGFSMAPVTETSLDDFTAQWRINTVTAFLTCREAVRRMRMGKQGGRVVNVAAQAALEAPPGKIAYVSAKAAVAAMTRALAAETRADGIWVNAILPGTIDTPANRSAMPDADFSQWTRPESIARTVLWLLSADNEAVSGGLIPV